MGWAGTQRKHNETNNKCEHSDTNGGPKRCSTEKKDNEHDQACATNGDKAYAPVSPK
jgi:hypothetical protein